MSNLATVAAVQVINRLDICISSLRTTSIATTQPFSEASRLNYSLEIKKAYAIATVLLETQSFFSTVHPFSVC